MPQTFIVALALSLGLAVGLLAQDHSTDPDAVIENYGAWTLRCGADRTRCHIFQALYRAEDRARLIQATIFSAGKSERRSTLRVLTPLGTDLARGASLTVDSFSAHQAQFIACWKRGCVAEFPLADDLASQVRTGTTVTVGVFEAETGRSVNFELSLDGLSRSLERLRKM